MNPPAPDNVKVPPSDIAVALIVAVWPVTSDTLALAAPVVIATESVATTAITAEPASTIVSSASKPIVSSLVAIK